jgi:hypothetical protein
MFVHHYARKKLQYQQAHYSREDDGKVSEGGDRMAQRAKTKYTGRIQNHSKSKQKLKKNAHSRFKTIELD